MSLMVVGCGESPPPMPPPYETIEDTVNVGIRQTLRLKLVADNPGGWMTHCHILPHAGGGMMTVLRVIDE